MKIQRRETREVMIGSVGVGGDNLIRVQTMIAGGEFQTCDVEQVVAAIHEVEAVGCEIVRVSVFNQIDAKALGSIRNQINIPLVADIHFDPRNALLAIDQGVDKIRWNPGNIVDEGLATAVIEACRETNTPMRIGVNGGSLREDIRKKKKYLKAGKYDTAGMMVHECLDGINLVERVWGNSAQVVLSLKASDPLEMMSAYTQIAQLYDHPLHLGVTEAGGASEGIIRSCAGMAPLLASGIGDTIRFSTKDPVEQVKQAYYLLRDLGLREYGIRFISCPTCGRMGKFQLQQIEQALRDEFQNRTDLTGTIAIMGCAVNGPGEAEHADFAIIGKFDGSCEIRSIGDHVDVIRGKDLARKAITIAKEVLCTD